MRTTTSIVLSDEDNQLLEKLRHVLHEVSPMARLKKEITKGEILRLGLRSLADRYLSVEAL